MGRAYHELDLGVSGGGGDDLGEDVECVRGVVPAAGDGGVRCGRRGWGRCNANLNPRGITSSLRRYAEAG